MELHQSILHPTIRFRLVDEDGNVLRNKVLPLKIKADYDRTFGYYSREISLTTSKDGHGEFPLPHADLHAGKQILKGRSLTLRLNKQDGNYSYAKLGLEKPFDVGLHDIGDLVLHEPAPTPSNRQILATGYVVDTDGNPLVGARIDAGAPVLTRDGHGNATRSRSSLGRAAVDNQGYFILYGNRPEDWSAVTLSASRTGYPSRKVPLLTSGQEHRIVLDAGNIIRGQVLLPLGMEQQGISLEFVPYSEAQVPHEKGHDPYTETSATDGLFRLTELPAEAGIVKIGLGMAWPFHPVATIENVFPWQVGKEGDPRFTLIDLRETLGVFRVTAVDENQVPLKNAKFSYVMRRKNGYSSRGMPSKNGTAVILVPETKFEVTVGADGYRTQDLDLSDPVTVVELEPALTMRCQLTWMPALSPGREIVLSLNPVDGSSSRGLLSRIEFNADGTMQTYISKAGQYEVSLGVKVNFGWSSRFLFDANGDPILINVVERNSVQNFLFDPPKDFYDSLLLPADRAPEED